MWPFNKTEKKGSYKDKLKYDVLKEINKTKKERFNSESFEKLNNLLRVFLNEKYKLNRSLTNEEMVQKIKNKKIPKELKIQIMSIASKLYLKVYSPDFRKNTKKEFGILIKEFGKLIENCSFSEPLRSKLRSI